MTQWRVHVTIPENGCVRKGDVKIPENGCVRKGTVEARLNGEVKFTDRANLAEDKERRRVAKKLAQVTGDSLENLERCLMEEFAAELQRLRQKQPTHQSSEQVQPAPAGEVGNFPWSGVKVPEGYSITPAGWVIEGHEGGRRILAGGPIWVEALARDQRRDNWGFLLVWRDRDGQLHRGAFPAGRFHEQGHSIVKELADGGLAIVPGQERALLHYLAAFIPQRRLRSVKRLGWVDDPVLVYVFAESTIGKAGDEQFVYQPETHSALASAPYSAGTLDEWQTNVAAQAQGNPVLLFCLCAAFAGPLLKFAGLEGGGFHLHGGSSKGKTTTGQVAASVWGSGADPAEAPGAAYIRKWNATANAVEAIAADHCDNLLVLDEIGEAQAHELGRLIYQLAGGQGKSRLARDASLRAPRTWRVIMLSTGEEPVQAVLEAAGRRARGGQLVRMVDVPATGDDGGIIHDPHGLTPAEFVHRLKRACATYYGTAGPAFIQALCKENDLDTLRCQVQSELDEAHKRLVPKSAAEEVSRIVRRFALVLVAGHLACAAGILPFTLTEIEEAVKLVLQRWLAVHSQGPMERAVEQLRAFLLRHEARFRDKTNPTQLVRDLAGYRDTVAGLFLLTPEAAQEALDGHSVRDVMHHLKSKGLLYCNEGDRLQSKHRISGIDGQVRLYAIRTALVGDEAPPPAAEDPDPDA
jgi:uncharacterized protein (DUF927 family)